jgi:hypothetical protein
MHFDEAGEISRVVKRAPLLLFASLHGLQHGRSSFSSPFFASDPACPQTASWVLARHPRRHNLILIGHFRPMVRVGVVVCSAIVTVVTCIADFCCLTRFASRCHHGDSAFMITT